MRNNTPHLLRRYPSREGNRRPWTAVFSGVTNIILIFAMISSAIAATVSNVQTYDQLVKAIRDVQAASQKVMDQEKVRVAWQTGQLIDEHILLHKERANYGENVIVRLAHDLTTSETELRYMIRFYRTYPIPPTSAELAWSRYREIISLDEKKAREEVASEAVRNKWSVRQVRQEVQRRQSASKNSNAEKYPSASPGQVYTYRVVKATAGPYLGQLVVDLGFSNYFQPDGIDQFREGDWVTFVPARNALISAGRPQTTGAEGTYTAYVTEVIDGDTFHALVDLGFKIVTEQKLRLRGLDAPEIQSADGREAKEFLLAHGVRPGAQILIKTVKPDKYGRYLADVFVDGAYINQQLFDEGLAVRVSE